MTKYQFRAVPVPLGRTGLTGWRIEFSQDDGPWTKVPGSEITPDFNEARRQAQHWMDYQHFVKKVRNTAPIPVEIKGATI